MLIKNMRKGNLDLCLIVFWVKLKQSGYSHKLKVLYIVMKRLDMFPKTLKKTKKKFKPYVQKTFPGERIQVDIKFVSIEYIVGDEKLYEYIAIDECSRFRCVQTFYLRFYNTHSKSYKVSSIQN